MSVDAAVQLYIVPSPLKLGSCIDLLVDGDVVSNPASERCEPQRVSRFLARLVGRRQGGDQGAVRVALKGGLKDSRQPARRLRHHFPIEINVVYALLAIPERYVLVDVSLRPGGLAAELHDDAREPKQ